MAVADDLSRYRYISRLGAGGMARVDLAEDTLLERRVALKRMNETTDPRGVSRLRREAMTGASLSHPNLVSIYDVCTGDDGRLVLVMEYVAGETLRARINRDGKLPVDESLRILEGTAAGLDAIHSRGIVHRDVKPSNILLGEDGVVKLADLGIASVPDGTRITTSGSIIGSLSYMAPEQLADTRASPAIDVYALAAVAFEMLAGRKARREANAVALAHALATQPPPDLRSAWPDAPADAAELLSRGMSRDPKARPRSAGDLVARLKAALTPEPTAAMPAREPAVTIPARKPAGTIPARKPAVMPIPAVQRPRPAAAGATGPFPPGRRDRARTGAVAAALLGLVGAAVVLVVVLNSGGRQHQPSGATSVVKQPARAASGHRTTSSASRAASSGSHTASSGSHRASTGSHTASTPAPSQVASTPSTSAGAGAASSGASSRSSASAAASGATAAATRPVSAVESFYGLAAAHRYEEAWALADSSMRAELRGYASFQAGQTGTRAITFNSARTVSQSTGRATVAIQTTSVRDDGTHHCTGTVDLVPAGASGWMLHQINIDCTA